MVVGTGDMTHRPEGLRNSRRFLPIEVPTAQNSCTKSVSECKQESATNQLLLYCSAYVSNGKGLVVRLAVFVKCTTRDIVC